MQQEIVERAARAAPDVELVGPALPGAPAGALASAVARTRADVAIVALSDAAAVAAYGGLLYAHPRLRLLAVTDGGRGAVLYELRPHAVPLGELSAGGLLDAVRGPSPHVA
ncbi:hypothetical protein tb265_48920 [Gemmatimonadetes bacterium T265]|nr:hypothetical protein tb265_48920 [Gemmatimonadetes bacterium T265]